MSRGFHSARDFSQGPTGCRNLSAVQRCRVARASEFPLSREPARDLGSPREPDLPTRERTGSGARVMAALPAEEPIRRERLYQVPPHAGRDGGGARPSRNGTPRPQGEARSKFRKLFEDPCTPTEIRKRLYCKGL